ncbi:hypothetical protein Tco_0382288 [Tanacetum coccineum]
MLTTPAEDAAYLQQQLSISQEEEAGIQSTQEESNFMATAGACEEIEKSNANCTVENNLQQASTSGTQTDKALPSMTQTDQLRYNFMINAIMMRYSICLLNRSTISSLQEEKKRLKSDFKIREDELLDKQIQLENKKLENENVELEFQIKNYAKDNAHLKTTYKNLFDSINVTRTHTKAIIDSLQNKLHDTIYENAKLRAQLFDKVSKQKDTTRGTSANTKFTKKSILGKPPSSSRPKLYDVTPLPKSTAISKVGETNALSNQVTSNSVPSSQELKVMENDNVIAPGMFRIDPRKTSRKNDVNSKTNGFSPKDVKSTTRTRRPQLKNNPKNDKVPSKSKSSWPSNNLEKIEENHRNLQSSSYLLRI